MVNLYPDFYLHTRWNRLNTTGRAIKKETQHLDDYATDHHRNWDCQEDVTYGEMINEFHPSLRCPSLGFGLYNNLTICTPTPSTPTRKGIVLTGLDKMCKQWECALIRRGYTTDVNEQRLNITCRMAGPSTGTRNP